MLSSDKKKTKTTQLQHNTHYLMHRNDEMLGRKHFHTHLIGLCLLLLLLLLLLVSFLSVALTRFTSGGSSLPVPGFTRLPSAFGAGLPHIGGVRVRIRIYLKQGEAGGGGGDGDRCR